MTPLQPPAGVIREAWERLAHADGDRWAIAERNADGEVIGTAYRYANGDKKCVTGSNRGLIVAWPLDAYAGTSAGAPVFVCEGASDTAALLGLGIVAVGVPMAGYCGPMLAELLADRHAVIVADVDEAGRSGGAKVAEALLTRCASVRTIEPPDGAKDARAAVLAGADRAAFLTMANAAEPMPTKGVSTDMDSIRPLRESGGRNELRIVSIADLGPTEEPDWIWPGYLARGAVTLFTGLWKAGKTTLLGHLLRDLYRGAGLVNVRLDARVLIISEEPPGLWADRRDRLGLPESILFVQRDSFVRPDIAGWHRLLAVIAEEVAARGIGLVAFDTLPSAWPVQHENESGETIDALMPLRAITSAGASVLLTHHPRKSDATEMRSTRGSGALPAFADIVVELRRHSPEDNADTRRVLVANGRYEGIPAEAVIDLGPDGYTLLGTRADTRHENELETIAAQLSATGGGLTSEDIRKQWPRSPVIGKTRLMGLLSEGAGAGGWERSGRGVKGDPYRYRACASGSDSIRPATSLGERNESDPPTGLGDGA